MPARLGRCADITKCTVEVSGNSRLEPFAVLMVNPCGSGTLAEWRNPIRGLTPDRARIRAEERLLRTQFGREYDAYRSRTARLLPGIY